MKFSTVMTYLSPSTIFALSTPLGRSGLCIFRISGPKAIEISNRLCGKNLAKLPRMMQKVTIKWEKQLIDSGLGTCFLGPNSATGEDVVEFSLHGSLAVIDAMKKALNSFSRFGAREAERGEFSKRALINGKMSLTEIEGLADLLDAETSLQLKIFQQNINGRIDESIRTWQNTFVDLIARLEAKIEFEEPDNLGIRNNSDSTLKSLIEELENVISDSAVYERVKHGFQVLIFGPPNVGKSSLMNRLARKSVSIVSEHEGTTRDLVNFDACLNGMPIRLIDSAGIRETNCQIENFGIELAKKATEEADVIVLLTDNHEHEFLNHLYACIDPRKLIPVVSKSDLISDRTSFKIMGKEVIYLSSVSGEGIDALNSRIFETALKWNDVSSLSARILLNDRQSTCLRACLFYIKKSLETDDNVLKVELLRSSLKELKKIRGEYHNIEEIYDRKFRHPCISLNPLMDRESILDLSKYLNRSVRVELSGGRKVKGILKGFDQLNNLVLEEAVEEKESEMRQLGMLIVRGPGLSFICPAEGFQEISNPFS